MTFEDLPQNWPELPLTTPGLASDVVDLFLPVRDRVRNSLLLLLCDETDRIVADPVVINDVPWSASAEQREAPFRALAHFPGLHVLVALSSRAMLRPELVERWRDTARRSLEHVGISMIGFHSADTRRVVPIEL